MSILIYVITTIESTKTRHSEIDQIKSSSLFFPKIIITSHTYTLLTCECMFSSNVSGVLYVNSKKYFLKNTTSLWLWIQNAS